MRIRRITGAAASPCSECNEPAIFWLERNDGMFHLRLCQQCTETLSSIVVPKPQRFYITQVRTGCYQVEDARYRGKSVLIRNENGYSYCSQFENYDDAEAIAQLLNNVIGGDE